MFGYLLLPITHLQKMFMLIGPKRSGKGTITRVLSAVVGRSNVAGSTLGSLTTPFGLQPLLNNLVIPYLDENWVAEFRAGLIGNGGEAKYGCLL